ncbi:MAG: potassium transporter TrkG, partial [Paracoccaceae bacterium]
MIDLRPVAYVIGRILIVLAILMVAPAIIDWRGGDPNAAAFAQSAILTGVVGMALSMATVNGLGQSLDVRQAYLLTVAVWALVPAFGALPFWLGAPGLPLIYAYFEGVSGITTTGASVITGLEDLPLGMHLWRGMLNWLGGLGIAFIAMIFLPIMRVGGMQFFRTEGFDTFGKALPRATDIARQLLFFYCGTTVVFMAVYAALGMSAIDAVVHGMTTIATGGFSTRDSSFADYSLAIHYAATLFIIIASLPYIRYVQLMGGQAGPLWRDVQVRSFLLWLFSAAILLAGWQSWSHGMAIEPAFRESIFNLTSIMSSTGYGMGGFTDWGGVMLVVSFTLGVVGACSGS